MADEIYGGLEGASDSQWAQGHRLAQAEVNRYRKAIQMAQEAGDSESAQELLTALNASDGPRAQLRAAYEREYRAADRLRGLTAPAVEGNAAQKLGAGLVGSLATMGAKLRNLLPDAVPGSVSDADLAEMEARNRPLAADPTSGAGWFGGQLLGWAGAGEAEAAALGKLASKYRGLGLGEGLKGPVARNVVRGVRQGSEMGAVEAPPGQKGTGAVVGALGGGAGAAGLEALRAAGRGLSMGVTPTADAAALREQLPAGTLTWGQTNPDSAIGRWEQNPINRMITNKARQNANEEINLLAANKSSLPLSDVDTLSDKEMGQLAQRIKGGERGSAIRPQVNPNAAIKDQLFDTAADSFTPYFEALNSFPMSAKNLSTPGAAQPLSTIFARIAGVSKQVPTNDTNDLLQGWLKDAIKRARTNGGMTAGDLRALREEIRKNTPSVAKDTTPAIRAQIATFKKAQDAVTDAIHSQLPQGASDLWRATDSVYGANKVLEKATKGSKSSGETLTGYELEQSARQGTADARGARAVARGQDSTRVRDAAGKDIEGTGLRDLGRQWRRINKEHPHTGEQGVIDRAVEFALHLPGGIAGIGPALLSRSATGRRLIQGSTGFQGALRAAQQSARDALPGLSGPLGQLTLNSAARVPSALMLSRGAQLPGTSLAAPPLMGLEEEE